MMVLSDNTNMENLKESRVESSEKGLSISWENAAPVEIELGQEIDFCQELPGLPRSAGAFKEPAKAKQSGCMALPKKLPLCRFCSCDATFVHDGLDPIYRKGIWERHKLDNVCIKKMSIEEQNNKGKWMLCDTNSMHKCHFYEPNN